MTQLDAAADDSANAPPAGAVISCDLTCMACGYNLRTLAVGGHCPECNLPIDQSLLVLPQPQKTAGAIMVAAWSLVVGFLLCWALPLQLVGTLIMLYAAQALRYRCELDHMPALASRIRWLWILTVALAIGRTITTCGGVMSGSIGGALFMTAPAAASGYNWSYTTSNESSGPAMTITHSLITGDIKLTRNQQGLPMLSVEDSDGQVFDSQVLSTAQALTLTDGAGVLFYVNLLPDGRVSIYAINSMPLMVPPLAAMSSNTTSMSRSGVVAGGAPAVLPAVLIGIVTLVSLVLAVISTVLYLLVCRGLALRARKPKLASRFRVLMWLFGLSLPAMSVLWLLGGVLPPALGMIISGSVGLCLLIAAIGQIVGSFKLASVLRRAHGHWTEIFARPAEGEITRQTT